MSKKELNDLLGIENDSVIEEVNQLNRRGKMPFIVIDQAELLFSQSNGKFLLNDFLQRLYINT